MERQSSDVDSVMAAAASPDASNLLMQLKAPLEVLTAAAWQLSRAGVHQSIVALLAYGNAVNVNIEQSCRRGGLSGTSLLTAAAQSSNAVRGGLERDGTAEDAVAKTVKFLVEAGAPLNFRGAQSFTPLHHACMAGWSLAVQVLLAAGADTEAETAAFDNSLHLACIGGHVEVVQILLNSSDAPALVQCTNADGWAPLHLAILHARLEGDSQIQRELNTQRMVGLLLASGAALDLVRQASRS
jgi:hypothetical protein